MRLPTGNELIQAIVPLTTLWKRIDVSQTQTTSIQVASASNLVLDLKDNNFGNGNKLQIWTDHKAQNQVVKIKDKRIVFGANKCMDVPDGRAGNGVMPQIWDCVTGSPNQEWTIHQGDGAIEYKNTGYYLNVKDGNFRDGGQIQLWQYNPGDRNFKFKITAVGSSVPPSPPPPSSQQGTGAGNFAGMNVLSFDEMCRKFANINKNRDVLQRAAVGRNIHPSFLGAICMQESNCAPTTNGHGYFQFSDDRAWAKYGLNRDKNNIDDSAKAAAWYYRDLLDANNQNINAAMNGYSGGWGGYVSDIYAWTSGYTPKSHQRRSLISGLDNHRNKKSKVKNI